MPHPYWPLYDVVVRTPRLELRLPDEDELSELARVAAAGVHDPSWMPLAGWTDQPSPQLERGVLSWHWGKRAQWTPTNWDYNPVVLVDGQVVGTQSLVAVEFGKLRNVETGSWLGLPFQGKGIGKEMRAAILHLAFEGLGARRALSGYWHDNAASKGVSDSLGYEPNGDQWLLRRDERALEIHVKLERATWEARRRDDITIDGLTAEALELFGAGPWQAAAHGERGAGDG
jgi:RimJ/RimL family protein N-acetyltransferase